MTAVEVGHHVTDYLANKVDDPNSGFGGTIVQDVMVAAKGAFEEGKSLIDTPLNMDWGSDGGTMVAGGTTPGITGSTTPSIGGPSDGFGTDGGEPESWSDRLAEVTPKPEDAISEETTLNPEDIFGKNITDTASTELLTATTFGGRKAGLNMPYGSTSAFGAVVDELQDAGEGATTLMGQNQAGKLTQARV